MDALIAEPCQRISTGGKGREEASLDSLPEDVLHLVFQAAQLHTAAGVDSAMRTM